MNITPRHIINWMQLTAKQIEYQKENLTQLDQLIGDGDHGINMNRGFKEVEKRYYIPLMMILEIYFMILEWYSFQKLGVHQAHYMERHF